MPDDEPQPSRNPFIRFKQHVDAHVGSGISVLTRASKGPDQHCATANRTPEYRGPSLATQQTGSYSQDKTTPPHAPTKMLFKPFPGQEMQDALTYWESWARTSPYSPHNLRDLPQPSPAGVAPEDAHLFGFEDAFQDLVQASAGRKLLDLRHYVCLKRYHSEREAYMPGQFPFPWVRRLVMLGLLHKPTGQDAWQGVGLPPELPFGVPPASVEEWLERKRSSAETKDVDEKRQNALEKFKKNFSAARRNEDGSITFNLADMLRELEQLTKDSIDDLEGLFDASKSLQEWTDTLLQKVDKDFTIDPAERMRQIQKLAESIREDVARRNEGHRSGADSGRNEDDEAAVNNEEKRQPSTEEDLFSFVKSATAEADKSWDTFIKIFSDVTRRGNAGDDEGASSPPPPPLQQRQPPESIDDENQGGRTITSTSREVDVWGYVHEKTDITRFDRDGNKVGHESRYSVRPSQEKKNRELKQSLHADHPAMASPSDNDSSEGTNGRSSGWFWR